MTRRISAFLISAMMLFLLAACQQEGITNSTVTNETSTEGQAEYAAEYHNGFYGVSFEIPEGWFVQTLYEENMTEDPVDSSNPDSFEVFEYEDGGVGMGFIEVWSCEDSADKEHASAQIFAELYDGVSLEEYVDAFEIMYSGDFDGYYSELTAREKRELAGRECDYIEYRTTLPDSEDAYIEQYYITEAGEYSYMVFCVTYWEGNEQSKADAELVTGCISFE